ncbi:MAG: hypothetical protein L0H79_20555 [Intrasporangium sp.]|uniref:hypothetical protein n=1 Tax=Intrasporangium sp. TaxID=1925024 RepID=UPI002649BE89|nr:hypothetical protein [Intrasporangium sp.]MDN5798118.1 hypothetical protein [Intrasporangium sp.]
MIHISHTDEHGATSDIKTLASDNGDQINRNADTGQWDAWHNLDERQVDDLTANTAATAVLHVYAFARVDALRVDYAHGPSVIYPAGQWPVLSVWADLFDQPNT